MQYIGTGIGIGILKVWISKVTVRRLVTEDFVSTIRVPVGGSLQ